MDKHYHPTIASRLQTLFASEDWSALVSYLAGLSNAHFRTAGYMIGERMLVDVEPEVFWEVMRRLVEWQPKAFTVTLAKAALPRLQGGTLSLADAGFSHLASALAVPERVVDREKILLLWLPAMRRPENMERLFEMFGIMAVRRRMDFLLRVDTLAAGFVLLRTLRFEEHDGELMTQTCRQLMRRGTSTSFNLASLLRAFFGLDEVRGTFSLTLQPYELARVDTDFDVFVRIVSKV